MIEHWWMKCFELAQTGSYTSHV